MREIVTACTPYMVYKDCNAAIAFYQKVFGAKLSGEPAMGLEGTPMADKCMHAEIILPAAQDFKPAMLFICSEMPEMGSKCPLTLGGTPISLYCYVSNCDDTYKAALAAGCKSIQEPADMPWGDRWCQVSDPEGHLLSICTHIEDVPPEIIKQRMAKMMKEGMEKQAKAAAG